MPHLHHPRARWLFVFLVTFACLQHPHTFMVGDTIKMKRKDKSKLYTVAKTSADTVHVAAVSHHHRRNSSLSSSVGVPTSDAADAAAEGGGGAAAEATKQLECVSGFVVCVCVSFVGWTCLLA